MKIHSVVKICLTTCFIAMLMVACNKPQQAASLDDTASDDATSDNETSDDAFSIILRQIPVPDMSVTILEADEAEQLAWLAEIYAFEDSALRSRTSGLNDKDLEIMRGHLSQVYGEDQIEFLIAGFYQYDETDQTYYVPDGSWLTYNDRWPRSELAITGRSNEAVTLRLTGLDDYGENEREIHHIFEINGDRLILTKRDYMK